MWAFVAGMFLGLMILTLGIIIGLAAVYLPQTKRNQEESWR